MLKNWNLRPQLFHKHIWNERNTITFCFGREFSISGSRQEVMDTSFFSPEGIQLRSTSDVFAILEWPCTSSRRSCIPSKWSSTPSGPLKRLVGASSNEFKCWFRGLFDMRPLLEVRPTKGISFISLEQAKLRGRGLGVTRGGRGWTRGFGAFDTSARSWGELLDLWFASSGCRQEPGSNPCFTVWNI